MIRPVHLLLSIGIFIPVFSGCGHPSGPTAPDTGGGAGGVKIEQVVAFPTASEAITLRNDSGAIQDISRWTLGNIETPQAFCVPSGTVMLAHEAVTYGHDVLGFTIKDAGDMIYLRDSNGHNVDIWNP